LAVRPTLQGELIVRIVTFAKLLGFAAVFGNLYIGTDVTRGDWAICFSILLALLCYLDNQPRAVPSMILTLSKDNIDVEEDEDEL
jgi:hypothetical protein